MREAIIDLISIILIIVISIDINNNIYVDPLNKKITAIEQRMAHIEEIQCEKE